jgi:PAS domain-containing protein
MFWDSLLQHWQSAALIAGAIGFFIALRGFGEFVRQFSMTQVEMLRAIVKNEAVEIKQHAEQAVIRTNGYPALCLQNSPFPFWYKEYVGGGFVMKSINPAYTKLFGVTQEEYVGKSDDALWPKATAEMMRTNDQTVYVTGRQLRTIESLPDNPADPNSPMTQWLVVKYPVPSSEGGIKGVAGTCYPLEKFDKIIVSTLPSII